MSQGMLGQLPLSKVLRLVGTLFLNLAGENGNLWYDELKKFVRRQPCWLPETTGLMRLKLPEFLKSNGQMPAVNLTKPHNPDSFYKDRLGLWVGSDFRRLVVAAAEPTDVGRRFKKFLRFLLEKNATGEQLKTAFPNGIFTATEFCPWLAEMIGRQPNGKVGDLLTNGFANLFLVEGVNGAVFVVYVRWRSGYRLWGVSTWPLGFGLFSGAQFVSRN